MKDLKFVDEVDVLVSSGKGGAGACSFRREKGVSRGGPDGGDGGNGGSILFSTHTSLNTLLDYRRVRQYKAQNGYPGGSQNCTGAKGKDLVLKVPEGTLIRHYNNQELIKDLKRESLFLFLKGGRGGKGNTFYKSSIHQAPQISQKGEPSVTRRITLELQLISDIGLLGFPSVGKSSLISRISAARPKIASYPFTTLQPHLGVVDLGKHKSLVIADLPGILPGASEGIGLGYRFLKHLQRTKAFLHILEPHISSQREPIKDYFFLQRELIEYDKKNPKPHLQKPLKQREQILVLNKCDLLSHSEQDQIVSQFKMKGLEILPLSVSTGYNIDRLLERVKRRVFSDT